VKPLSRRERIEVLLDHWPDFWDVASRDAGFVGEGNGWRLSGMSRHPSVVELGRALESLRVFAPNKFAHLAGFYGSEWRSVDRPRRIRGKNGKLGFVDERVRERVVPGWVRAQKVRDAVSLVAQDCPGAGRPWIFRGDPFLPAPLLEGIVGKAAA
jgi:hypothetical protein